MADMNPDEKPSASRAAPEPQTPNLSAPKNQAPLDSAFRSGVRIVPPWIFAGVFLAGLLLQHFFPIASLPGKIGWPAAVVFAAISGILTAWSYSSFWRVRTSPLPVMPSKGLATTGPYRLIRNPMYVSVAFLHAGLALWFQIIWALVLLPVAIAIVHYCVIPPEEKYLERRFGKEYLDYKARVPRWFPHLHR